MRYQNSKKMQNEEVTIESFVGNDDVKIGYSDNDIIIIDDIQKFVEFGAARLTMNGVAICTSGKIHSTVNSQIIEFGKNQVAVFPKNTVVTDFMISPDFKLKAMFFTDNILQSFLHEKMNIWNEIVYVHRSNILTLTDEDVAFFEHFYGMLKMAIGRNMDNPYRTEIVQAFLRAAMLAACGVLKSMIHSGLDSDNLSEKNTSSKVYFQKFLDLLHTPGNHSRSVDFYAKKLCISSKYLLAVCKANSGKTASKWITEAVLEQIRHYLRNTDLSIKQICEIMDFPNPSFFGKYVKEHLGVTPMEYRNQ